MLELNFPEIETRAVAEWLVAQGIRMEEMLAKKRPAVVVTPGESGDGSVCAGASRVRPGRAGVLLVTFSKKKKNQILVEKIHPTKSIQFLGANHGVFSRI